MDRPRPFSFEPPTDGPEEIAAGGDLDVGLTLFGFDQLFDGKEVVPECYAVRHAELTREGSLEAAFLRVTVSFGQ